MAGFPIELSFRPLPEEADLVRGLALGRVLRHALPHRHRVEKSERAATIDGASAPALTRAVAASIVLACVVGFHWLSTEANDRPRRRSCSTVGRAASTLRIDGLTGTAGANLFDLTGPGTSARGLGGDDIYIVDRASDRPIEAKGGGTDTVESSVDYALASCDNVENLTLTGTGDTDATGNTLANVLRGNSGDNTLSGDLVHDSLFGGGGADTYLFDTRPTVFNFDHIRDFSHAQGDMIALDLSVFRTLGSRGPIEASEFVLIDSKSEIVGSDAHLLYIKATGTLYYDADGAAGTNRSQIAVLDDHAALTFQDFEVV